MGLEDPETHANMNAQRAKILAHLKKMHADPAKSKQKEAGVSSVLLDPADFLSKFTTMQVDGGLTITSDL